MVGREKPEVIVPLQFLRGIAALGVVIAHLLSRYERRGVLPEWLSGFYGQSGETGVFTFFAISGFIMVHITLRRPAAKGGAASWHFLLDRFTRVAPLYYLTTVLIVAFSYMTRTFSTNSDYRLPTVCEWILSFLFIPFRTDDGIFQPIYGLGWTLQYEIFFYILFAIGIAASARQGIFLVFATILALALCGLWVAEPTQDFGIDVLAYIYTRPVLLYFTIGMAIAWWRHAKGVGSVSAPAWLISAIALILFCLAAAQGGAVMQAAAIFGAILVVTMVRIRPNGSSIFERIGQALGDASYAIYLTHSFFLGAFASVTASLVGWQSGGILLAILLACCGCFAAGWLVWRLVELPLTALLRRRSPVSPKTGSS